MMRMLPLLAAAACWQAAVALPSIVRPPGPYSEQLVPPVILYPEPLSMTHGSTDLPMAPETTHCSLLHSAADSPIVQRAVARYLGGNASHSLTFPWGARPPILQQQRRQVAPDVFTVTVDVDSADEELQHAVDESYTIEVSADARTAVLHAPTVWGALRALETFSQLVVPVDRDSGGGYVLPLAPWSISDKPEHSWRGLMLDTSRRFYPLEALETFIDAMSQHKFNVLHWHATDAVSLPIASTTFPNLTLGAFSAESVYSPEDVSALLRYAKDRGVRIVLELDMPGHNWAYSVAFPHLFANCSGEKGLPIATEFWQDAFDPTQPALYEFVESLLEEMTKRFPDSVMHLGGDEVDASCWANNPQIATWLDQHGMNATDLYPYFETKVAAILHKLGKRFMAWDDVYEKAPGAVTPGKDVVHAWRSPAIAEAAVADGIDVVTSHGYYLTAGDGPDTDYVITWEMIYGRNPADLNWNSPHAPPIGPPSLGGPHFLGAEGCIWGESVWPETLHSLTWPRASVLAERLWLPDRFFGHANTTNGKGLHPPEWQGELTTVYEARLIQWMCQLLRRGLAASPVDDRDKFPRRSLWQQCNIDLPPPPAKQRPPTPPV